MHKQGAHAHGYDTDRWTQRRIQQVIAREFGVTYHTQICWAIDEGVGLECAKRRARERDEELIVQPGLATEKSVARRRHHVEFGLSFCEPVATTWAPRG